MTSHGDRAAEAQRTGLPDCGRDVSGRFVVKAGLRFGSAGTAQRISLLLPMVPSFRHVIHCLHAGRHSLHDPSGVYPSRPASSWASRTYAVRSSESTMTSAITVRHVVATCFENRNAKEYS